MVLAVVAVVLVVVAVARAVVAAVPAAVVAVPRAGGATASRHRSVLARRSARRCGGVARQGNR